MLKRFLFQTHWLIGITAGVVLAIVGLTGGILSFESGIQHWLNRDVRMIATTAAAPLSPDALLSELRRQYPDKPIVDLTLSSDPNESARVTFAASGAASAAAAGGRGPRGEVRYADPYTGELFAGEGKRGQAFFRTTRTVHRWLTAGAWGDQQIGRQIVGASTLLCIVLVFSGVYLRWPRRLSDWRTWLTFDPSLKGRSFLWHLHAVLGTWVLLAFLMMSFTGLYWSYDWYRNGLYTLAGVKRPAPRVAPSPAAPGTHPADRSSAQRVQAPPAPQTRLDTAWSSFAQDTSGTGFSTATLTLPRQDGQPIEIRYADADPQHERAWNTMALDANTGAVVRHERYAEKPAGERFMASIFPLHSGSFFGLAGLLAYMLASLSMPVFTLTGWLMYLGRRKKKAAARAARMRADVHEPDPSAGAAIQPLLLAFASQTGGARELAWQTAGTLRAAGIPVEVQALARIGAEQLRHARQALFVVSTFGEGEPPDEARSFVRRVMRHGAPLSELRYGVLALGDRRYKTFCAFGHALDRWLHGQGARSYFSPIEVDNSDPKALIRWLGELGSTVSAGAALGAWQPEARQEWHLAHRSLLNPGSEGGPTFHIELTVARPESLPVWKAGDIAEIHIASPQSARGDEPQIASIREFSIASLPEDGELHLLVRQVRKDDGALGLGSGLLTVSTKPGDPVSVRIRSNPGFHAPEDDRPMVLMGNGTGIAGLRSHIKARVLAGRARNWLIFGERSRAHDFYYSDEISAWQAGHWLQRVDLAFSRDQAERVYIQHTLRAQAGTLQGWIADGAALYVCGSAEGMAQGVHATLIELLGEAQLERLTEEGRYRRDVY